jgi:hypothetical protein
MKISEIWDFDSDPPYFPHGFYPFPRQSCHKSHAQGYLLYVTRAQSKSERQLELKEKRHGHETMGKMTIVHWKIGIGKKGYPIETIGNHWRKKIYPIGKRGHPYKMPI